MGDGKKLGVDQEILFEEFLPEGFSMKWMLKLERIDEAGNLHSTTVAYVERPELTSEADLGLTS